MITHADGQDDRWQGPTKQHMRKVPAARFCTAALDTHDTALLMSPSLTR